jgi:hypothetical protein
MIKTFVKCSAYSDKNLKFTVFIETPSKAFSLGSVCQLYGLNGDTEDPTMVVFPVFSLIHHRNLQYSNLYIYSYLLAGTNNFKGSLRSILKKNISGPNGHGKNYLMKR